MSNILETFFFLFESDSSALDKGLKEAQDKAAGLTKDMEKVDDAGKKAGATFGELIKRGIALAGVGVGLVALVKGINATAESHALLDRLASQFRDTTDAIDGFLDASKLLGVDEATAEAGLRSMDRAIQDVFLGMGKSKKVFEELGLTVTDAHGKLKPVTQVMGELSEKFKGMEKGTQIRIMEKLGLDPALIKVFNTDMAAMQKRMSDIDRAAGFNLDAAVRRSTEYIKATKELRTEIGYLRLFVDTLSDAFKTAALPVLTEGLKMVTHWVRVFTDYLMQHADFVKGVFIAIGVAITAYLLPAAIRGAIAVWAMMAPFLLIGAMIVGVIALFALLYEDIMAFIDGGDSLIGHVLQKWPIIGDTIRGIIDTFREMWRVGGEVAAFLADIWNNPTKALKAFLQLAWDGLMKLVRMIPGMSALLDLDVSKVVDGALNIGKDMLATSAGLPLGSLTSGAQRAGQTNSRSTSVQIGKIDVNTQATDAQGISTAIGASFSDHLGAAAAHLDDGVMG